MSKSIKIPKQVLYVCTGSKCKKRGSKELGKLFKEQVKAAGLRGEIEVIKTNCTDRCKYGSIFCLQPKNLWLQDVTEQMVIQLFNQEVLEKRDNLTL